RAPRLPKNEGLNRFVWNMQHKIVPSVPDVYIEANFSGHKVVPGTYTMTLAYDGVTYSTKAVIQENPEYKITKATYEAYDVMMNDMEAKVTDMHNKVNALHTMSKDINKAINQLEKTNKQSMLIEEGKDLLKEIKDWDELMVQRRSKAYDDVENFENKFTAEYLFLMNQTNSSLPIITQACINRKAELDSIWASLKQTAENLINIKVKAYNKKLWDEGIGAIKM
ncbi:MAG: glycosyl hydrolase, partial [Flavobacteriaceae bacterium]|nr:glycosyl hydrolase [Flavobacteriaceae bacterium]